MGIQDIENRILKEAALEANNITKEAQNKATAIIKQYQAQADEEYNKITKDSHRKAETLKKSILVPARLEAKKALLAAKHKILDEVFKGISPQKKEELLSKVASYLFE